MPREHLAVHIYDQLAARIRSFVGLAGVVCLAGLRVFELWLDG